MTDEQFREMAVAVARVEEQMKNLSREVEAVAGRVRTLEMRGVAGGSNGRRQQFATVGLGGVGAGAVVALFEVVRWLAG